MPFDSSDGIDASDAIDAIDAIQPMDAIQPTDAIQGLDGIAPVAAVTSPKSVPPTERAAGPKPLAPTLVREDSFGEFPSALLGVAEVARTVEDATPQNESAPEPLVVRIIRSARRKKTVGAQIKDGVLEVTVPKWMSGTEAEKFAEQFRKRFEKTRASTSVDLAARARSLCRAHDLPKPLSIRWVTNQNSRWGSCTPTDSTIRINNRLAKVPTWVLDYVIVHELCHLRHPNHSPEFWALVNTYPLTERARGFLMGMGMSEGDHSSEDTEEADDDTDLIGHSA